MKTDFWKRGPVVPRDWGFRRPKDAPMLVDEADSPITPRTRSSKGAEVVRLSPTRGREVRHEATTREVVRTGFESRGLYAAPRPRLVPDVPAAAPRQRKDERLDEVVRLVKGTQTMFREYTRRGQQAVPRQWDYRAWSGAMRDQARQLGVVI